jgi:hypothetical protein
MKPFKEFFFRKLMMESPKNTGDFDPGYSDTSEAKKIYNDVINDPNSEKVFTMFPDTYPVHLYLVREGHDRMLYFVPTNDDFIYGYATYEMRSDGGIEMYSVYNRGMYHGLAKSVYQKYLIPNHPYIMSHSEHSNSGRNFWRSLVLSNLGERKVTIWDMKTNKDIKTINNISELDDYYSDNEDYERYRIRIYR